MYLEGILKIPPYSFAWAQPLSPVTQKFNVGITIADPLFCPPKRSDIVSNLLETTAKVLEVEEVLFERLRGQERIPSFEAPAPPANVTHPEWNTDLNRRAPSAEERIAAAQAQIFQQEQIA
jgi:hypothetical protein